MTSNTLIIDDEKKAKKPFAQKLNTSEKTDIKTKLEDVLTVEEARALSHAHIKKIWKK